MNKLPLTVSSNLTALSGLSTLGVTGYANNTGKTGSAAPVLISVESEGTITADALAAAMPTKGGQGTEAQARLLINAFASVLEDLVLENGAITVNTPVGTIETFIAGSLENACDQPDPETNTPFLGIVPPDAIMKQFAEIQAYVPTAACPASLKRICDKATGLHEIHGTSAFYAQGYGMTFGSTGETLKLLNPLTRAEVATVSVDSASKSKSQLTCTLPGTAAIPAGEYILQLKTLAGGGSLGGTLWPLELKVKLTQAIVPTPGITKVKQGTREDDLVGFGNTQVVISGCFPEGWKASDLLRIESLNGGAVQATCQANEFVNTTASTAEKLVLNKIENLSEKPDSDWNNHPAKFVFKRGDAEYSHEVSWLNA